MNWSQLPRETAPFASKLDRDRRTRDLVVAQIGGERPRAADALEVRFGDLLGQRWSLPRGVAAASATEVPNAKPHLIPPKTDWRVSLI